MHTFIYSSLCLAPAIRIRYVVRGLPLKVIACLSFLSLVSLAVGLVAGIAALVAGSDRVDRRAVFLAFPFVNALAGGAIEIVACELISRLFGRVKADV
jgi:hypothetical protein